MSLRCGFVFFSPSAIAWLLYAGVGTVKVHVLSCKARRTCALAKCHPFSTLLQMAFFRGFFAPTEDASRPCNYLLYFTAKSEFFCNWWRAENKRAACIFSKQLERRWSLHPCLLMLEEIEKSTTYEFCNTKLQKFNLKTMKKYFNLLNLKWSRMTKIFLW